MEQWNIDDSFCGFWSCLKDNINAVCVHIISDDVWSANPNKSNLAEHYDGFVTNKAETRSSKIFQGT